MNNFICQSCGQGLLIRALEAVVPTLCPSCGPVYALAKNVSRSEKLPSDVTYIAGFVCGVMLLFAGAVCADKLIYYLTD